MLQFSSLLFAQAEGNGGGGIAGAIGGLLGTLIMLAIAIGVLVGTWKVFEKAGKPGWACLIPIYNIIVILEIVGRPIWWIVGLLIPCLNIVVIVVIMIDLAKSFGKDAMFGLGLAFLGFIFFPLLGFGDAKYIGPSVRS